VLLDDFEPKCDDLGPLLRFLHWVYRAFGSRHGTSGFSTKSTAL
jgi:hypothetical protein